MGMSINEVQCLKELFDTPVDVLKDNSLNIKGGQILLATSLLDTTYKNNNLNENF
jgi:hypothetical protein